MDQWQNLTAGGVLALLIIREVLGFLKTRNGGSGVSISAKELHRMASQIEKLYDWHDQKDEDGVPVWYVRKSLERHIGELTETLRSLVQRLDKDSKER
jgi:hypothetical protein